MDVKYKKGNEVGSIWELKKTGFKLVNTSCHTGLICVSLHLNCSSDVHLPGVISIYKGTLDRLTKICKICKITNITKQPLCLYTEPHKWHLPRTAHTRHQQTNNFLLNHHIVATTHLCCITCITNNHHHRSTAPTTTTHTNDNNEHRNTTSHHIQRREQQNGPPRLTNNHQHARLEPDDNKRGEKLTCPHH